MDEAVQVMVKGEKRRLDPRNLATTSTEIRPRRRALATSLVDIPVRVRHWHRRPATG